MSKVIFKTLSQMSEVKDKTVYDIIGNDAFEID